MHTTSYKRPLLAFLVLAAGGVAWWLLSFWLHGGSAIVAPTGEIVAKGTTEQDEVISYDCDLSLGEYIRNTTFNFAKHRRPEHYKLISERTGVKVEPSN